MQQSPAFAAWMELSHDDPRAAELAIVHAAAWHDSAGDKVSMEDLFARAMNYDSQSRAPKMVQGAWSAC